MKKWLSHIIYIAALAVITSCSSDLTDEGASSSDKVNITFTLAMNGSSPARSANDTWGDNYDPSDIGDDKDNRIDVNSLQVVIYSVDGSYWKKVEQVSTYQDATNKNIYHFRGSLSIVGEQIPTSLRMMVFANYPKIDENVDLAGLTYSQSAKRIPMWGVASYANLKLVPGELTDLGIIDLLRAMAKVEVTLDQTAQEKGYSLTSVQLNDYNETGYCLPTGYDKVEKTKELGIESVFRPYASWVKGALDFEKITEGSKYVIYVPEYQNKTKQDVHSTMSIALTKDSEAWKEAEILFKDYSQKEQTVLFDIIRNHYYQFNITIDDNDKVNVKLYYMVEDWTTEDPIDIPFN